MTTASQPVSNFLSWWGGELADLLGPKQDRPKAVSVIEIEGDMGRLAVAGAMKTAVPLPDLLAHAAAKKIPRQIVLRFASHAFYSRSVQLPQTAQRDFAKLLAVDLERATPFKTNEVYAGYELEPAARGSKQQPVRHVVIKRAVVNRLREQIEAAGFQLAGVETRGVGGAVIPIDIRPGNETAANAGPKVSTLKGLAALAIALTASLIYFSVHRQERALSDVMTETASLKIGAQAVREKLTKVAEAEAAITDFNALRQAAISRAAILEELTKILPDSAWLTEIKIKGAAVDISGLAVSASALMPLIEASPYFVDAQTLTPVMFDQQHNKERFGIRMRLRKIAVLEQQAAPADPDPPLPEVE